MANVRNGNTYHIDSVSSGGPPRTTNALLINNVRVKFIVLASTGANGLMLLSNNSSTQEHKIQVVGSSSGNNVTIDLSSSPISFPNGVAIETLTNAIATLVIEEPSR